MKCPQSCVPICSAVHHISSACLSTDSPQISVSQILFSDSKFRQEMSLPPARGACSIQVSACAKMCRGLRILFEKLGWKERHLSLTDLGDPPWMQACSGWKLCILTGADMLCQESLFWKEHCILTGNLTKLKFGKKLTSHDNVH